MSIFLVLAEDVEVRALSYLLSPLDPHIVSARTLADARRLLVAQAWSVIIFDDILPDGSGLELLRDLGKFSFEGGVIVLGAARDFTDKVTALERGADDYFVRPYEPAELHARVSVLLRRARHRIAKANNAVIQAGALELNVDTLEVVLPGARRARLAPNEMRVLHYLMTHADRVVDHQELITRLFGAGDTSYTPTNAVGVYIRRVREKIETNPSQPRYIITVRGHGYRFEVAGG